MAVAYVQSNVATSSPGVTTLACAFTSNVGLHSVLLAMVSENNSTSTVSSITDTLGNTWAKVSPTTFATDTHDGSCGEVWICKDSAAGANTATAHFSSTTNTIQFIVTEISGADNTTPVDGAAGAFWQSTATPASPSITTTANGDLIFGCLSQYSRSTPTPAAGSGFTLRQAYSGTVGLCGASEDQIQTTAGAITSTFTNAGASNAGTIHVVAIKAASGSSDATVTPTGQAITSTLGSAPAGIAVLPTGQSVTATLGTPTVSLQGNLTVTPTGFSLASSLGTFGTEADITMTPAGGSLTMSLGTPTTTGTSGNVNIVPTGYAPAFSLGTPVVEVDEVFPVTGFAPAFSLGTPTVVFPDLTVLPTGFVIQVLSNAVKVTGPSSGGPHFVRATTTHGHKSRIILPTDTDIA